MLLVCILHAVNCHFESEWLVGRVLTLRWECILQCSNIAITLFLMFIFLTENFRCIAAEGYFSRTTFLTVTETLETTSESRFSNRGGIILSAISCPTIFGMLFKV